MVFILRLCVFGQKLNDRKSLMMFCIVGVSLMYKMLCL